MASSRRSPASDPRRLAIGLDADEGPPEVVRREPFADSPRVGARGQRTQQRILDAALQRFGEFGYDRCSVDAIAERAGCSRAAFYQYFSSKEDVFHHLTGRAARQLNASTEALEPITPDEAGWLALRAWILRYADVYDRYESLFQTAQAASQSDEVVASGSGRWRVRTVSTICSRVTGTRLEPSELDAVVMVLLLCIARTHDVARILRSAAPDHYDAERVADVLTDVAHRSLFGLREEVNVRGPATRPPPALRFDPVIRAAFARGEDPPAPTPAGGRTWRALVEGSREAFVRRGYHRTRISDVVAAAGVSRGTFYRYFESKDQLARELATRAMRAVALVLAEFPAAAVDGSVSGRNTLRRWLRRYNRAQTHEAAILRVWVDAALQDTTLRFNSAPAFDFGRRTMAAVLRGRGFGDADTEGVAMVALLSSFGETEQTGAPVHAAAHVIERGFFGLPGR